MNKFTKTKNDRPTDKELDVLWREACKARDNYICVYTKEIHHRIHEHELQVHHIMKKATHRMRWDIDNGITLYKGIHFNVAHGPGCRPKQFEQWALGRLPKKSRDRLNMYQNAIGGVDRFALKVYLLQQIRVFKGVCDGKRIAASSGGPKEVG